MSHSEPTLIRKLAHELRDALSPLASAADLARLRRFDPESSRLLAEKVERGLRRALQVLDAFVLAEQSEQETLRGQAEPEAQQEQTRGRSEAATLQAPAGAQRILIVDDSYEVRRAYREALVTLGYTVLEAGDAEQALSALETTTPNVALIDIHLPRMNGYRLAQNIRARGGRRIYLVMLSGMALDAVTRALAREAGFDDCLDKMAGPLALRELLAGSAERNSLGNVEK